MTFVGMPAFPANARTQLGNEQLRRNLGHATRTIRDKRAERVQELPEWEELRLAGEAIKARLLAAFYVDSDEWKAKVVVQARQALFQAVSGLSSSL